MKRTWFLSGGYLVSRPCEGPTQKPDSYILLPGRCCLVDSGLGKLVLLSFSCGQVGLWVLTETEKLVADHHGHAQVSRLTLVEDLQRDINSVPKESTQAPSPSQALSHRKQPSQPCFPRRSTRCSRCLSGSICRLHAQHSKSGLHSEVG